MSLVAASLWSEHWSGLDLTSGPGRVAVLAERAAGSALARILCGGVRPKRGTVTFGGADPARTPALRSQIAAVLEQEELPEGRTVAESVARVLAVRRQPRDAAAVLGAHGLERWAPRSPRALSNEERRAVALVMVLEMERPAFTVLFEPLEPATLLGLGLGGLVAALRRQAATGATVVSITASAQEARRLGEHVVVSSGGRVTRVLASNEAADFASGEQAVLVLRTTDPVAVVRALEPDAHRLSAEISGRDVRITTRNVHASARSVARAVIGSGTSLEGLFVETPHAEAVRAAAVEMVHGESKAAFDRAYRRAAGREEEARRAASEASMPAEPPLAGGA